jgi:predicted metal-dependent hydrolase
VQLVLPLLAPSGSTRRTVSVAGRIYQVNIARHRRARRYLLRVSLDGSLRLTVPRGASIADGLQFAAKQSEWIERERVRQRRRMAPWRDGTPVLFRGGEVRLQVTGGVVACGGEVIRLKRADADIRTAVEAHLMGIAGRELPARCLELAAQHDLNVARVAVRSQKSRWGSCSPRGVITLNWRLIQMPVEVLEYVLLHELMHLRQPNHSRRFWREVGRVCPTWRESERWLRKHGREIL